MGACCSAPQDPEPGTWANNAASEKDSTTLAKKPPLTVGNGAKEGRLANGSASTQPVEVDHVSVDDDSDEFFDAQSCLTEAVMNREQSEGEEVSHVLMTYPSNGGPWEHDPFWYGAASAIESARLKLGHENTHMILENQLREGVEKESLDLASTTLFQAAQRVLSMLSRGQDVSRTELPPQFLLPYSLLQRLEEVSALERSKRCWGSCLGFSPDPMERVRAVLCMHLDARSLSSDDPPASTVRSSFPVCALRKPFNPVLGETHRFRCGQLFGIAEQVSHHPPVTALYIEHRGLGFSSYLKSEAKPVYEGTHIRVALHAKQEVYLHASGEVFYLTLPDFYVRLFGWTGPYVENVGTVHMSHYDAEGTLRHTANLQYKPRGASGRKRYMNRVRGSISRVTENGREEHICTLRGRYDDAVYVQEDGREYWRAPTSISEDQAEGESLPNVEVLPVDPFSDSSMVWAHAARGVLSGDAKEAGKAKAAVENAQRHFRKRIAERAGGMDSYSPQLFFRDEDGMYRLKADPSDGPDPDFVDVFARLRYDPHSDPPPPPS